MVGEASDSIWRNLLPHQDLTINPDPICETCGARVAAGSKYCGECGVATSSAQAASPSTPSPARRRPPPPPPRAGQVTISEVWAPPQTNMLAIASLTLGILWLGWLGSFAAVIAGHMARRQIATSNGSQTGNGLATAGLVLGYIGLGFLLIYVIAAASIS
jgi:hypothetical protein